MSSCTRLSLTNQLVEARFAIPSTFTEVPLLVLCVIAQVYGRNWQSIFMGVRQTGLFAISELMRDRNADEH